MWTAVERADSSQQLAKCKWLCEIIIGACIESGHAIVYSILCSQNEDRRTDTSIANRSTQIEPGATRKHDVENDQVIAVRRGERAPHSKRWSDRNIHPLLFQTIGQDSRELRVIFNEQ